jgi:uncharacterized membrane protein HdeD (DUF308 family)
MYDLLTRNWWVLILRGILAVTFGVLAFSRPGMTLAALVLLFGAYVFVDGIFAIFLAIGGGEERRDRWLLLLEGALGLIIGIMTFWSPGITALSLILYIAAWSLATGVLKIAGAVRLRKDIEGEVWLALSGIASILFAFIVLWNPVAGALAFLWVIATYAILFGAFLIILGFKVHGLRGQMRRASA